VNSSNMSSGEHLANITVNCPEANNPVETVRVTLYMSEIDVLQVHVSFAGRGSNNTRWIEPFDVWLFSPGTSQKVWEGNRTTNSTGWFNISDIVVGTYDVGIKNWTCLSELATGITVSEGAGALVDFGTTREGDANNDEWVTSSDKALLYNGWGSGQGSGTYDPHADFNRDGWLTSSDKALLYGNWGESGDLYGYF
jgi:hypothetical protein